ncbi:MAG: hypothetical protein MMC23_009652 [Stictis urceolatum]|nr:hypothetical protein [Stictis urceolata]
MSEDRDLLSRISQLAGKINIRKGQPSLRPSVQYSSGDDNALPSKQNYGYTSTRRARPTYMNRGRTRGSQPRYTAHGFTHRNRSLVLSREIGPSEGTQSRSNSGTQGGDDSNTAAVTGHGSVAEDSIGWVSKRDRHLQLINTSIYDRDLGMRTQAIERTRQQKSAERNLRERRKIANFLKTSPPGQGGADPDPAHSLLVAGIRFQVCNGGSKLKRIKGMDDVPQPSPQVATVGGVRFFRSKSGNLYRAGLVRSGRAGQLRLLGNPTVDGKLQDEANDVSSDEEIELEGREDDVDSDDLQEEVLLGADEDGNNALLQDFVHL